MLDTIASGGAKTLQELAAENAVHPGQHSFTTAISYGKGFGYSNKRPALTLTEKLAEPLRGKKLVLEFLREAL